MNSSHPMHSRTAPSPRSGNRRSLCRGLLAAAVLAGCAWGPSALASSAPPSSTESAGLLASAGPLLQPAQLHALMRAGAPLHIIDLRGAKAYAKGHLPGALSAPYPAWRGPGYNPGRLLTVAGFTRLVRSLGLHRDDHVVLVSAGGNPTDFGAPARVFWTLKWLGMSHLSILNGGMQAWHAAGLAGLRQGGQPAVTASDFEPQLDNSLLATREQVLHRVDDPSASEVLLDARPKNFWEGKVKAPAAVVPGTIPGALDFSNMRWFPHGGGALPSLSVLQAIARNLPPQQEQAKQTISFCNTGHWAATNWFVLAEMLHRPDVRLYPGSVVDWSRHHEPMTHVPSRSAQLWTQLKQTVQAR